MRSVAFALLVVFAFGTACPTTSAPFLGGANSIMTLVPGYQYPFQVSNSIIGSGSGAVQITADPTWNGAYLYIRISAESTFGYDLKMQPRLSNSSGQAMSASDPDILSWSGQDASLATSFCDGSYQFMNLTASTTYFITFFPEWTVKGSGNPDIQIELALLSSSTASCTPSHFMPHPLVQNQRTFEYALTNGSWVFYWETVASTASHMLYASFDLKDPNADKSTTAIMYYQMGMPNSSSGAQQYPNFPSGGSFVTQTAFQPNATGTWYFAVQIVAVPSLDSDPAWSFKTNLGSPPCSGAGSIAANFGLLALLFALLL